MFIVQFPQASAVSVVRVASPVQFSVFELILFKFYVFIVFVVKV